jgi:hypothetical protein
VSADCGSREGGGFEPRRSPSYLQVKRKARLFGWASFTATRPPEGPHPSRRRHRRLYLPAGASRFYRLHNARIPEHVLDYLQDEDEGAQNPVRFAPLRREGLGRPQETGAPKSTVEVATPENFAPLGALAKVRLGLPSEVGRVCVSCD